ncbi:14757_t:CDS:2, partial [Racocetra persica]
KPQYTSETILLDLSKSFDTSHPPWSIDTKGAAPGYTATLLKNGYILYIGGTEKEPNGTSKETNVNMNNIPVFDTDDLTWISM